MRRRIVQRYKQVANQAQPYRMDGWSASRQRDVCIGWTDVEQLNSLMGVLELSGRY